MIEPKRDTVGKISSELLLKDSPTTDVIELTREMQKDYLTNLYGCIDKENKNFDKDFYIVVLTKKERLMPNVLRDYFLARRTCPTPNYDQAVYKYYKKDDKLEFLWVIPCKEMCLDLIDNALMTGERERGLLKFVIDFRDGTLFKLAKKLNGEAPDSSLLIN